MAALLLLILFLYLIHPTSKLRSDGFEQSANSVHVVDHHELKFNYTYPLTAPVLRLGQPHYRIAIIADMDTSSKSKTSGNTWISYLKLGTLSHNRALDVVEVTWDVAPPPVELSSHFALKGELVSDEEQMSGCA